MHQYSTKVNQIGPPWCLGIKEVHNKFACSITLGKAPRVGDIPKKKGAKIMI
jgi:hypothetical protein